MKHVLVFNLKLELFWKISDIEGERIGASGILPVNLQIEPIWLCHSWFSFIQIWFVCVPLIVICWSSAFNELNPKQMLLHTNWSEESKSPAKWLMNPFSSKKSHFITFLIEASLCWAQVSELDRSEHKGVQRVCICICLTFLRCVLHSTTKFCLQVSQLDWCEYKGVQCGGLQTAGRGVFANPFYLKTGCLHANNLKNTGHLNVVNLTIKKLTIKLGCPQTMHIWTPPINQIHFSQSKFNPKCK